MGDEVAATHVSCDLHFAIERSAVLALGLAIARQRHRDDEVLIATRDGRRIDVVEVAAPHGGRIHIVAAEPGALDVSYRATWQPIGAPSAMPPQFGIEMLEALRPSRYCPSDRMAGFAASTFSPLAVGSELAREIGSWVFEHIALLPGSSGPSDSAIDTLLLGAGVCRDFAHLTITLCRSLGVPARYVAVYAPGLSPMEMHAVVEVHTENGWEVLDPTRRAPRSSLVRAATGRDAADAALVTTVSGSAQLLSIDVLATTDDELPSDDHQTVCVLE